MVNSNVIFNPKVKVYLRKSTSGQEFERQVYLLNEKGYTSSNCLWYEESYSAKTMDRPILQSILSELQEDDVIVVESLSRLARSTKDLLSICELLEKKKATLISLKENIDMTSAMGKFFITVMGGINQLERDLTAQRTKEALTAKKASGVQLGRPKSVDEDVLNQAVDYYMTSRLSYKDAAEEFGINYVTLFNECKKRGLKRKHYKKGKI